MGNLVVLAGNGLSIAFNPNLRLDAITSRLTALLSEGNDGDAVSIALKRLAQRYGREETDEHDFESLVGALAGESETIEGLVELARAIAPNDPDLKESIARTVDFLGRMRDAGVSHVLEVIFEGSRARGEGARRLKALVRQITSSFSGTVTVANLNYDTLLLAALLDGGGKDVGDLAGEPKFALTTDSDPEVAREFYSLRTHSNFGDRRIRLLHLHGSLAYWRTPEAVVKVTADYLEKFPPWPKVRAGSIVARPVVVLAAQRDKSSAIEQHPFSIAYAEFSLGLDSADHWLIIGYSFRDAVVNERLRASFDQERPRSVLVATLGNEPSRALVEGVLGGSEAANQRLTVFRSGAHQLTSSDAWHQFVHAS